MKQKGVKVFGVGLQKTGTTTLGECMRTLGYLNRSYDHRALHHLRKGNYKKIKETMDKYESFDDEPWARLYKFADEAYPKAKFILTTRKSSQAWYGSLTKHCDRILFNGHRKFLFGSMFPRENKQAFVNVYEEHNKAVIEYFKGREEKLLVLSFDGANRDDAWEKIGAFLGCEVPSLAVPKKNSAPSRELPPQTRLRTLLYIPKYLWSILKRDYIKPLASRLGSGS